MIKLRENNPIVQLSDFDTVLQFKSDDSIKKAQTIVGTIKYLAPEIRNADECEPNDNIPGVIKGYDPFSADSKLKKLIFEFFLSDISIS